MVPLVAAARHARWTAQPQPASAGADAREQQMSLRYRCIACALALAMAGCATTSPPVMPSEDEYYADSEPNVAPPAEPIIESPPIEPVEPPAPLPSPAPQ